MRADENEREKEDIKRVRNSASLEYESDGLKMKSHFRAFDPGSCNLKTAFARKK